MAYRKKKKNRSRKQPKINARHQRKARSLKERRKYYARALERMREPRYRGFFAGYRRKRPSGSDLARLQRSYREIARAYHDTGNRLHAARIAAKG